MHWRMRKRHAHLSYFCALLCAADECGAPGQVASAAPRSRTGGSLQLLQRQQAPALYAPSKLLCSQLVRGSGSSSCCAPLFIL